MTRLWDRGEPLDERVLRYTAGEDHLLDARLVPYDARASIAHAEMLAEAGLLAPADAAAIRAALAARRGDRTQQRAALAAAIDGFERVEMALHADAARLQVAAVDADSTAWNTIELRLRAQDIRNPAALLRTLVPRPQRLPHDARAEAAKKIAQRG